ncbi:MAG: hypothetical protein RIQ88_1081 [Actinomycetota bacterium]|jgi:apolipoprotein N-acyltransferase
MHKFRLWLIESKNFWGKSLLAVLAGLALASSFPAYNFGLGVFFGIFLLLTSIKNLGFFKSLWLGFFAGFAFYGLVLIWLTTYLGPIPWFALCLVEGLFFAIAVAMISITWRFLEKINIPAKKVITSFAIGAIYLGREYVAGHFPFGGLAWARLGLSQVDNFMAKWAWAVDISGLTWLLVFISAYLTLTFLTPLPQGSGLVKRLRYWLPVLTTTGLVLALAFFVELPKPDNTKTLRVAAVQGNANAGLFAVNPPGSILDKHLTVAKKLVASGKAEGVELMVWPENSSDLDPVTMVDPSLKISEFVNEELKAPLLFGNKTYRGSKFFNEVDLWEPNRGLVDWYDKKRPVPFGEYVPYRSFFMALAPDMIGLIGWDMAPGERDGIFKIKGKAPIGSLICFEATIDELHYDLVDQGAQALMIQTNSSDFGRSIQGVQLAAISRMRAIETGRTVVAISTVGLSGIYSPDGQVLQELPTFTPAAMVQDITLRSDKTPAMIFGRYIEPTATLLGVIFFLIALLGSLKIRRKRTS